LLHRPLVQAATETVRLILTEGRAADRCLEKVLRSNRKWGSRDRRFIAESVYEIVRHARLLEELSRSVNAEGEGRAPKEWNLFAALHFWRRTGELPDWPEFRAAGWLNRRAAAWQAEIRETISRIQDHPAILHSIPDWLDQRALKEIGPDWIAWRERLNSQAPVVLRQNTLRIADRARLLTRLAEEGVHASAVADLPEAVILSRRQNVFSTSAFSSGAFEVQDGNSQKVVAALDPQPGEFIIDACAGAGGKALHAASRMGNKGRVLAMDIHQWKLDELRKRARRAGADIIETRLIESSKTVKRLADKADRLLLDVPCSGLGVLRRNPDSKWRLSEDEIQRLIALQAELLDRYSQMLKAGGTMVYSTCSLLPSENERQIERFLASHSDFQLTSSNTLPVGDENGFDGFYIARLTRIADQD
jgi:16S rRNA (cytosine967-C5)-methyltransferase